MKKIKSLLMLVLIATFSYAQNLKPVAQKVYDAYRDASSVTVSNMFKAEPANAVRLTSIEETISKATFLGFDKAEAQQIINSSPKVLSMILPNAHGNPYTLKLVQTKFTTPDFQVTSAGTGKAVEVETGLHYQGIIDGDNNSIAAISIYKNEVMGLISAPSIGNIVVGKIENNFQSEHILYNDRDFIPKPNYECNTLADSKTYTPAELQLPSGNRGALVNCIRLFWEVDNSIYTGKGGMTNTITYITGLFNQHQIIYTNDGIPVELSELFVWDVTDPYTGTTSSQFLGQFQNYRNTINGDLGHLLGYGGGGGVAAGFSGICAANLNSSQCYSGINSTYNNMPAYSWSVMVVTHEQGHLMGSRHTHACVWNGNNTRIDSCGPAAGYTEGTCAGNILPAGGGTIMSYCHLNGVGINLSLGFGPQPQAVILNKYNTGACLTACVGTACMPSPSMNTTAVVSTGATFNWTVSTGATGYNIRYRIVGTSTWSTATSATTSYAATVLTPGSNYEWQVQTVCQGAGTSIFTISTNFTTPPLTCDPPINLTTSGITSASATLNWSGIGGAVSYNIQYRVVGTSTWSNTTSLSAFVSISGLISNTAYEWQVQTLCAGGATSAFSQSSNFTTLIPPCSNSQNNFTTNIADVSATLNWTGGVGTTGISYNLRYKIVGTSTWTTASIAAPASSINIAALTPNSNYEWQLQTVCQQSSSAFSNSILFTTLCSTINAVITANGPTTFCVGGSVTLNATPTGAGYACQWRLNGNNISGATNPSYLATTFGSYDAVVTLSNCNGISNSIIVSTNGTISIVLQPNAANGMDTHLSSLPTQAGVNLGSFPTFISGAWTANSTPFINRELIKFDLNGVPSNAVLQQATLTLYHDPNSNFGNPFGEHSNLSGSNTSFLQRVTSAWDENVVTWNTQPTSTAINQVILPQSTSVTQDYNLDVSLMVQDMILNPSSNHGFLLKLQTEVEYRALMFGSSDNAEPSNWPKLTFSYYVPLIATITGNTTFCAGGSTPLTANTGTGITYQWYRNSSPISGATASTYAASNSGTFYVIENSTCGTAQSNSLVITQINNPDATISYTTPLAFCAPGSVLLTANTYSGVTYQWQKNGTDIAGATNQTYSATNNGTYRVRQTANGCSKYGSAVTTTTTTSVTAAITANGPVTFCTGGSVVLSVTGAVPGYSYQWKNNNVNIGGATTSSYTATAAGSFTCTVTANCGNATSNIIQVSTNGITATIVPAGSVTICNGGTAALSTNTGAGYAHQWYLNGNLINGATTSTYSATAAGSYTVDITSPCGNATSAATTVGIAAVTASMTPAGTATICAGSAQTFTANTGYNYTYKWFRNGTEQVGATSSTYSNSSYGTYTVRITQGGTCSATSAGTLLNVTSNPTATITAGGPTTFCAGQSVTLTSSTFAGVSYQWQKNSADIAGGTNQTYTATTTGTYRVKQTANSCTLTSVAIAVTVNCRVAGVAMSDEVNGEGVIKVMPNPFSNELTVSGLEFTVGSRIQLMNVLGEIVLTETVNPKLKTGNIPNGIYFLQVTTGIEKQTIKVVKQ